MADVVVALLDGVSPDGLLLSIVALVAAAMIAAGFGRLADAVRDLDEGRG